MSTSRRLIVFCPGGLGNRLRVLVSARVLARVAGRRLVFLWPLNSDCNCPFERLFMPSPDVETVPASAIAGRSFLGSPPDLTRPRPEADLELGTVFWLIRPDRYPHHGSLVVEAARELEALRPAPLIADRVAGVASTLRRHTVGVHLRRGDFRTGRPSLTENTECALALTYHHLRRLPDAGVLLVTDDGAPSPSGVTHAAEGAAARFAAHFGPRLMTTRPRSLDRGEPEAIEDALVDLLLLRRCDALVGTVSSSFSHLAHFGRDVPVTYASGAATRIQSFEQTFVKWHLRDAFMKLATWRLGVAPDSFVMAWSALRHSPEGDAIVPWIKRLLPGARARAWAAGP